MGYRLPVPHVRQRRSRLGHIWHREVDIWGYDYRLFCPLESWRCWPRRVLRLPSRMGRPLSSDAAPNQLSRLPDGLQG